MISRKVNFNLKNADSKEAFINLIQNPDQPDLPAADHSSPRRLYKKCESKKLFGDYRQFQASSRCLASGDKRLSLCAA